jgi:hypothetical protein
MEVPARYYLQFPQRLFLPVPVEVDRGGETTS